MSLSLAIPFPIALICAVVGNAILVIVFLGIVRIPGTSRGLRLLGLALLANTLRHLLLLILPVKAPVTWVTIEILHSSMSFLILAGAVTSISRRLPWRFFWGGWLFCIAWIMIAVVWMDDPAARNLPLSVISALALGGSGWGFWWKSEGKPASSYRFSAIILIFWAIDELIHPWVLAMDGEPSIRFLPNQVFSCLLAIALIQIAIRSQRYFGLHENRTPHLPTGHDNWLDTISDHLFDGVFMVDETGSVLSMNQAAFQLFGCSKEDMGKLRLEKIMPDLSNIEGINSGSRECRGRSIDGATLFLELAVNRSHEKTDTRFICIVHDISERRIIDDIDDLMQKMVRKILQDDNDLFSELCIQISEIFSVPLVWIATRCNDGRLELRSISGPPQLERYVRGKSLHWTDNTPSRSLRLNSPQTVDWDDLRTSLQTGGMVDGLILPLRVNDDILGVLAIHAPHIFCGTTISHLETLSRRIGIVLQFQYDQRRLQLMNVSMETSANAIMITDTQGRIEMINKAFTRQSGFTLEETLGKTPRILRSGVQTEAFYHDLWSAIQAGKIWRGELVERRKDGVLYTVQQTVRPVLDQNGHVSHFVVIHEDVTERKQAEERMHFLACYDTLTGLPNRSMFRERLRQSLTRASMMHLEAAVLFLDLDHFNRINDIMGHEIGDRLLGQIVERLSEAAGQAADSLSRVGGDEFGLILTDRDVEISTTALARSLLSVFVDSFEISGQNIPMNASIGISLFPKDGETADQLMKNTDMAMFRAIREAPNGYRFFSAIMNEELRTRVTLERDLRQALGHNELILYYQPQFDIQTGHIVGLEALVRWQHPTLGLVSPGQFIPLAEETGLIVTLGDEVLTIACRQIRAWLEAGVPLVPVAVNLSAAQLRRGGLVEHIVSVIEQEKIEPRWLELELTESAVMEDALAAERTLRSLNGYGIKLSIDDFGTGYSSLSYLKRFPVAKLKIDQSFVRSLANDENDAAIARAIITLGHSMGLEVLSEGVETSEQLEYLRLQQCDTVQGFFFSRPIPADEIPPLLKKSGTVIR